MKWIGIMVAALMFGVSFPAHGCDLKSLPFGDGPESVADAFHLDRGVSGGDLAQGDTRAKEVCDTLPPSAVMRFIFLKGRLGRVTIESREGSGELLKIAEDNFGVADQRPMQNDKLYNNFRQHWVVPGRPVVMYTMKPAGEHFSEFLAVTASGQEDIWADVTDEQEKAMNGREKH